MKQDPELFRKILLRIEELCPSERKVTSRQFSDLCPDSLKLRYHIRLLIDAGFIEAYSIPMIKIGEDYCIEYLTLKGNAFLASIRDDQVWHRFLNRISGVGFDIVSGTITAVASSCLAEYVKN